MFFFFKLAANNYVAYLEHRELMVTNNNPTSKNN